MGSFEHSELIEWITKDAGQWIVLTIIADVDASRAVSVVVQRRRTTTGR